MKSYRVFQVDAFTNETFCGNPAGVVLDADGLSETNMKKIARELNNSETAFVFSPTSKNEDVYIRFFTPTIEVPSCGHATISAHYVRAQVLKLESCVVQQRIGIGILPVEIKKELGDYRICMTQGPPSFISMGKEILDDTIEALGIEKDALASVCPLEVVSTGNPKLMVGIKSKYTLNRLSPSREKLVTLGEKVGAPGIFVFTLDSDCSDIYAHGRMFGPLMGIDEDPVTGNANGPLGAYAVRHSLIDTQKTPVIFTSRQGEAIGRTGDVEVIVHHDMGKPQTVQIAGNATICFETEICL